MGFLKTFGSIVLKGLGIAMGFGPVIAQSFPAAAPAVSTVENELQQIASIVMTAEAMGQALNVPGAQKLTMAAPLVAQIILQSSLLAHHKIADPAGFNKGVAEVAGGMADILNALEGTVISQPKTV